MKWSARVPRAQVSLLLSAKMKERVSSFMDKNHIEENKDRDALAAWLDEDMAKCIKDKSEVMTNIAGALWKSLNVGGLGPSRDDLLRHAEV